MTDHPASRPPVALVAAMGAGREIGLNGTMPWHLPADLKHFRHTTLGHTMLMGRRTFESIGKALPGRTTFIVTRDRAFKAPDCRVFQLVDSALQAAPQDEVLMVTGGATLYKALLPTAQRLYLTRINARFDADTYFPQLDESVWREVAREDHGPDDRNPYEYSFLTLERY